LKFILYVVETTCRHVACRLPSFPSLTAPALGLHRSRAWHYRTPAPNSQETNSRLTHAVPFDRSRIKDSSDGRRPAHRRSCWWFCSFASFSYDVRPHAALRIAMVLQRALRLCTDDGCLVVIGLVRLYYCSSLSVLDGFSTDGA
jgi:hypothetical protein